MPTVPFVAPDEDIAPPRIDGLGRGLLSAAPEQDGVALHLQQQDDAQRVFSADAALKGAYAQFAQGLFGAAGADADGITARAQQWWSQAPQQYEDALDSDAQRALYQAQVQRLAGPLIGVVAAHEAQQRHVAALQAGQASIAGSMQLAAANAANPQIVADAREDVVGRSRALSQLALDTRPEAAARMAGALGDFHRGIIGALTGHAPAQARAYFTANRAEVPAALHAPLQAQIDHAQDTQDALAVTAQLSAQQETRDGGLAYIRQNVEGGKRQAAEDAWLAQCARQDAERRAAQTQAAETAQGIYDRTGSITAIDAQTWSGLSGAMQTALRDSARAKDSGRPIVTDAQAWATLARMAADDPAAFSQQNLREQQARIAPADLQMLQQLQAQIGPPQAQRELGELAAQLKAAHGQMKFSTQPSAESDAFDLSVSRALASEQAYAGKPLDYAARQEVIQRVVDDAKLTKSYGAGDGAEFSMAEFDPLAPLLPKDESSEQVDPPLRSSIEGGESRKMVNEGPANRVDFDWIISQEGSIKETGYVPNKNGKPIDNSAMTAGGGVDLGQWSERQFRSAGLEEPILVKIRPFLSGAPHAKDMSYLKKHKPALTKVQARRLTEVARTLLVDGLARRFDAASTGVKFFELPENTQTAIADVAYQLGDNFRTKAPKLWDHLTRNDWEAAYTELMNFGKYPDRRKLEAEKLRKDIDEGYLKKGNWQP